MRRRTVILAVTLLVVQAIGVRPRAVAPPPCEFEDVERIVAVGDVHGAYDRFVEILKTAGVIDARSRWSGGKTHLVQLGDVVDRGPDSRKALDLLQRLTKEAVSAGGRVHALIGNHEAMRMMGDVRYTTPKEIAAFVTPLSVEVRLQAADAAPPTERARILKEMPLGMLEMLEAFKPGETYGKFIRNQNAVVRINGILFLHGGISPATVAMSCATINDAVRKDLSVDFAKTLEAPLKSLVGREDGPLWYRGLAQEPDSFAPTVDEILAAQHARAMVVAHTVQSDGRVSVRFGGKVFLMDTGMQPAYAPDGRASALEIRGGVITAIYVDRRVVLAGGI